MPTTTPGAKTAAWLNADAYERYMGRWSRRVAPLFLSWLAVAPARRWLDVGCGTGALSAAILECCAPRSLMGADPSEGFLRKAREQLGDRASLECASASVMPFGDAAVDVTVSALLLNFAPDASAALAEMTRVTASGGTLGAYVWDYGGKMDLIRMFWDAAIELDPQASGLDEGAYAALCRPEALAALFMRCGLAKVDVHGIEIAMPFGSFDDFWQPFLGGQGPAPAYAMSLAEPARERLRERLRARLPLSADGSAVLAACAWAVRGVVR